MSLATIRQSMCTAVKAISPTLHSDEKFREWPNTSDFVEFCEKNPASARRLFFIRGTGDVRIESDNSSMRWEITEVECVVAYPRDFHAGELMLNDLDDLIESDLLQFDATIGTAGYSTLEDAVSGVVTTIGQSREDGEACVFGVLRLRVEFWRATQ